MEVYALGHLPAWDNMSIFMSFLASSCATTTYMLAKWAQGNALPCGLRCAHVQSILTICNCSALRFFHLNRARGLLVVMSFKAFPAHVCIHTRTMYVCVQFFEQKWHHFQFCFSPSPWITLCDFQLSSFHSWLHILHSFGTWLPWSWRAVSMRVGVLCFTQWVPELAPVVRLRWTALPCSFLIDVPSQGTLTCKILMETSKLPFRNVVPIYLSPTWNYLLATLSPSWIL